MKSSEFNDTALLEAYRAPFTIWTGRIRQTECRNLSDNCAKRSSWETAVDLPNRVAGGRYQMSMGSSGSNTADSLQNDDLK